MRHGWEPYLCRYRDCPRAIQGFISSFLRQEHENSHTQRFRCSDTACEVLGSGLVSRAALNKHNKKYHDGNSLAAIPTSLRKASVRPQHDRPRFLLKEPSSNSRKRSFHRVEEAEAGSWSSEERRIFRTFIRQHGNNWRKIAMYMKSRTWHEVDKSLFNNGYTADICRAR